MTFFDNVVECRFYFGYQSGTFVHEVQILLGITLTGAACDQFGSIEQCFRVTVNS